MTPGSRPAQVRWLAELRDQNQRRTGLIGDLGKIHPLGPCQSSALMIELTARFDATPLRDELGQQPADRVDADHPRSLLRVHRRDQAMRASGRPRQAELSRRAGKTMNFRSGAAGAAPLAPEDRYINREKLCAVTPASDVTIWRWQRDSEFALPVKLADNERNYWRLPDVRAWMCRREERQARPVRHRLIWGGGKSTTPICRLAALRRALSRQKIPIGWRFRGPPGIDHKRGPAIYAPGPSPRNMRRPRP